jgi:hypothetical protein
MREKKYSAEELLMSSAAKVMIAKGEIHKPLNTQKWFHGFRVHNDRGLADVLRICQAGFRTPLH